MYKLKKRTESAKSEVELQIDVPYSEIEREWKAALAEIKADIDLPGFRRGMAPDDMVIDRVGEGYVLEKASQRALNRILPKVIEDEKLDIITAPDVMVTKLEKDQPFELTAKLVLMPKVTLGDYKKIAEKIRKEAPSAEVSDDDVMKYVDSIRKQRGTAVKRAELEQAGKADEAKEEIVLSESELPALDDAFVKTLGAFSNVDDFMEKVRTHLEEEKVVRAREQVRVKLLEEIIAASEIDVPDVLIEQELDKMMSQFESDVKNMGMKVEDYYKAANKDSEGIRKEWRDEALKRAKANIVLPEIASREKLVPDPALVDRETEHVVAQVKDADPRRARLYVFSVLLNERVFDFLEGREPAKAEDHFPAHDHSGHSHDHGHEGHVHDENCKHD
jgi:trigger factor